MKYKILSILFTTIPFIILFIGSYILSRLGINHWASFATFITIFMAFITGVYVSIHFIYETWIK